MGMAQVTLVPELEKDGPSHEAATLGRRGRSGSSGPRCPPCRSFCLTSLSPLTKVQELSDRQARERGPGFREVIEHHELLDAELDGLGVPPDRAGVADREAGEEVPDVPGL